VGYRRAGVSALLLEHLLLQYRGERCERRAVGCLIADEGDEYWGGGSRARQLACLFGAQTAAGAAQVRGRPFTKGPVWKATPGSACAPFPLEEGEEEQGEPEADVFHERELSVESHGSNAPDVTSAVTRASAAGSTRMRPVTMTNEATPAPAWPDSSALLSDTSSRAERRCPQTEACLATCWPFFFFYNLSSFSTVRMCFISCDGELHIFWLLLLFGQNKQFKMICLHVWRPFFSFLKPQQLFNSL